MLSPAEIVQMVILFGCVATCVFVTVLGIKTWRGDRYLCDDCKYNNPTDCLKAERPKALDCTAYRARDQQAE